MPLCGVLKLQTLESPGKVTCFKPRKFPSRIAEGGCHAELVGQAESPERVSHQGLLTLLSGEI